VRDQQHLPMAGSHPQLLQLQGGGGEHPEVSSGIRIYHRRVTPPFPEEEEDLLPT
jgi:hypothetical protein